MKISPIMHKVRIGAVIALISVASLKGMTKTATASDIFIKSLPELVENKNVISNLDDVLEIKNIKQGPRNTGVSGKRKTAGNFFERTAPFSWIFGPKNKDGGSASCNRMIRNSRENNKCNTSKKIDRTSHNKRHKTVKTKRAETTEVAQKSEYCRSTRNPDVVYKVK